ncbi:cold shock domain-containing protein [Micromonospora sp. NPDC050200]|uniref:cold shock domain-containing protein n=1 Tax=Micromonospora sp. NPDC050200 TaxID=3155664 RepID=UPI0033C3C71A
MTQMLDRNRLYALIGALEDDLRDLVRAHLLGVTDERQLLGPAYDKAVERYLDDAGAASAGSDILDYLDLGDEIAILNRSSQALPAGVRESLAASARRLEDLIGIRNRVMHRRPLLPDDYDNAARWLKDLHDGGFVGDSLKTTLKQLREDPTWSPTTSYARPFASRVINNLPLPDFDETGLIGRRRQVERVRRLLIQRRFPVLTLAGPGGVGKTALALQTLHEVAEDLESPYDLIAWVSLKTEQLTAAGVQVIREAVRSLEDAIPSLAAPLDTSFAGGINEIAQSLEGIDAILAIDNLETVSAAEVVTLVDQLPATVTCLFTSRVGLGEIERREIVGPLEMQYAVDLFRRLCRARQIEHFAKLPPQRIEQVLRILGTSPLAIKWFVLAVEAGQSPETILRQQTDLIRFCVQNVYQGLSERAKDAAVVLAHVNRPLTVQDMKLYFPDTTPDDLRFVIQELLRRSLCTSSLLDDSMTEHFQATDALVEYLRIIGGASNEFLHQIQRAEDEYRREEERLRLEQGRTPLRVNVISGAGEHRASALRLRQALTISSKGNTEEALRIIHEIEQLEPEYWELFRVRGFLLSQINRIDEATLTYEQALKLARDEESRARVHFFYAGHLTRKVRDSESALVHAKAAHKVLQRHETALELGKALTYVQEFSSAVDVLRRACRTPDVRGQLIAGTQLVDTLRRRAEVEADELRSPSTALESLKEALDEGSQMLAGGIRDRRLEERLWECLSDALRFASWLSDGHGRDEAIRHVLSSARSLSPSFGGKAHRFAAGHAARLLATPNLPTDVIPELKAIANRGLNDVESASSGAAEWDVGSELVGTVKTWKPERSFGFISAIDGSGDYFFHATDLENPPDRIFLNQGISVEFIVAVAQDRPRAAVVRLRDAADLSMLRQRRLTIRSVSRGFLLAQDDQSGSTVFVGRHAFKSIGQFNSAREGASLTADLEVQAGDRISAVAGTVVVG